MIRSRRIGTLVAVFVALMMTTGVAHAQDGPAVTVEPATALSDGDTLTVTVSGFPADSTSFSAGECATPLEDFLQQCDVTNIVAVPLDSEGAATFDITIKEGPIGTGTCGEGADQCVIAVGSLTEPEVGFAPIFFGADAPPTAAADEPAAEELATTGPRELAATLVIAMSVLLGGFMMVGASRRWNRLGA